MLINILGQEFILSKSLLLVTPGPFSYLPQGEVHILNIIAYRITWKEVFVTSHGPTKLFL